jgi:hypothetical protein
MNTRLMAMAVREVAQQLRDVDPAHVAHLGIVEDSVELLKVLARILEGIPAHQAFGAPGDYGYETSIGKALAAREDVAEVGLKRVIHSKTCVKQQGDTEKCVCGWSADQRQLLFPVSDNYNSRYLGAAECGK